MLHVSSTAREAGKASEARDTRKLITYEEPTSNYIVPQLQF